MGFQKKYIWIIIIGAVVAFFIFSQDSGEPKNPGNSRNYYGRINNDTILTRDEALDYYWDEIKEYVSDTYTIEACSFESGNCYSLDADIYNGYIETVYFDNGGYLHFYAEIDESGYASDFDANSNSWDFTVDMNSYIIDDAIYEWADDNGYTIE